MPSKEVTPQWDEISSKLQRIKRKPSEVTSKEWAAIKTTVDSLAKRRKTPFNPKSHKERTKSTLAKWFLGGYFTMLIVILVYVPIYNVITIKLLMGSIDDLMNAKDAFIMVSSQLGPLLGFVLGYYFKSQE